MSIEPKSFTNADEAIKFLESLAYGKKRYVFRGQKDDKPLTTTYARFLKLLPASRELPNMIELFEVGLIKNNIIPFKEENKMGWLDWMEYARHCGVPVPCIDFSYSPYVALFFAFNGLSKRKDIPKEFIIYALDVESLALEWAKHKCPVAYKPEEKEEFITNNFHTFLRNDNDFSKNKFPDGELKFISFPGRRCKKMQDQHGVLLYDTVDYGSIGFKNLDDFMEKAKETSIHTDAGKVTTTAMLFKVSIKTEWAGDIFNRLELMGVTGGRLLSSPEGVADDVRNAYHYNPKVSYLRDVSFDKGS